MWIEVTQPHFRRLGFTDAQSGCAVNNLALQVAFVDDVEINQANMPHAGSGEVQRQRRAKPAGSDQEHAALLEFALPFHTKLRQDQMPRIPADLFIRQRS